MSDFAQGGQTTIMRDGKQIVLTVTDGMWSGRMGVSYAVDQDGQRWAAMTTSCNEWPLPNQWHRIKRSGI